MYCEIKLVRVIRFTFATFNQLAVCIVGKQQTTIKEESQQQEENNRQANSESPFVKKKRNKTDENCTHENPLSCRRSKCKISIVFYFISLFLLKSQQSQ